jgi:hypothetical protein
MGKQVSTVLCTLLISSNILDTNKLFANPSWCAILQGKVIADKWSPTYEHSKKFRTVDLGNEVGRLIKSSITENTREVNSNGINCFDPFRELWSRSRSWMWQALNCILHVCIIVCSTNGRTNCITPLDFEDFLFKIDTNYKGYTCHEKRYTSLVKIFGRI